MFSQGPLQSLSDMPKPSLSLVEDHHQVSKHLLSSGVLWTKLKMVLYGEPALTLSPTYQTKMLTPYYLRGGQRSSMDQQLSQ